MNLEKRIREMEKALEGQGVVIDPTGFIYRLAVTPFGEARIAKNKFLVKENTVIGYPLEVSDFKKASEALLVFNNLKTDESLIWRKDDRVFYSKE